MKKIVTLAFLFMLFLGLSSCVTGKKASKNQGFHYGWYQNEKNPHNKNYTPKEKNEKKEKHKSKTKK